MICYLSWIEPTFTGGKAMSNILIMKPIAKWQGNLLPTSFVIFFLSFFFFFQKNLFHFFFFKEKNTKMFSREFCCCVVFLFQRHHQLSLREMHIQRRAEGELNSSLVNYFFLAELMRRDFCFFFRPPAGIVRLFRSSLYTQTHTEHRYYIFDSSSIYARWTISVCVCCSSVAMYSNVCVFLVP